MYNVRICYMHILWNIHKICKHPLSHVVTNIFSCNENSWNLLSEATIKYTLLLTLVTRLCVTSPGLIYLITESAYLLTTFTHFPPLAYPVLCFCESWFFILFLFLKYFYWSIVALQCWVSFYCIAKWISHMYTPSF